MSSRKADPPYRIVTERLVLRCWEPADAPRLHDAVGSSIESLGRWMPWARDETSVDERARLLRRFRSRFDLGEDFIYGIFDSAEAEVVGGTGLHPRGDDDSLEIGYWVRDSRVGNGFATEATAALTRVALELCGVSRVDIRVDRDNLPSLAIPRRLGYHEDGTLRRRLWRPGGERGDAVVFSLFPDELETSPARDAVVEAYDDLGRRVL